jgi:hypothetical protein
MKIEIRHEAQQGRVSSGRKQTVMFAARDAAICNAAECCGVYRFR